MNNLINRENRNQQNILLLIPVITVTVSNICDTMTSVTVSTHPPPSTL